MTEPTPPETPPPQAPAPRGWVRARRAGLGATGLIVAVFCIAGAAAVSPLLVAGGMVATTAVGAGVWHLPRIRRHFAHPDGRRPQRVRGTSGRRGPAFSRPGGRRLSGPGRKSPLGGRSRSGGGRKPGGGAGRGLALGKRAGGSRPGAGRRPGAGLGKGLGKSLGRKGGTGGGGRKPGGSLLKRGKPGGSGTGRRAGKGLPGARRAGGGRGGASGRRRGNTGALGRRRAGGPPRGPAGRRTGTGRRGGMIPGRGSRRRTGAAGRGTARRPTAGRRPGAGPGRGARATGRSGRASRWKPWGRRSGRPGPGRPGAGRPGGRTRPAGRSGRRGLRFRRNSPRRGAGATGRPRGSPGSPRATGYARRGPHRFARFMPRRRKGPARPAPKPRVFGGPAATHRRTWRHPWRGVYRARPTTGKGRKGAHKARASRLSFLRWAAGRHPLYVVHGHIGRVRRARGRARRWATGWWGKRRASRAARRARRTAARQPMTVHAVRINGMRPPPPPPRPSGPRPRPRRVEPVSSGPAGAQAAQAARARREGTMLEAVDEAVTQHLAGWAPETAVDMINMFEKEMPGMLENLGAAFATLGDRTSSDMPLDPIVGEHMGELASAAHSMADVARELASSFRQKHEVEINRIENPRAAENVWDRTD